MNPKNKFMVNYRSLSGLALGVGAVGAALQFWPDFAPCAALLTVAVQGGLMGGRRGLSEWALAGLAVIGPVSFNGAGRVAKSRANLGAAWWEV